MKLRGQGHMENSIGIKVYGQWSCIHIPGFIKLHEYSFLLGNYTGHYKKFTCSLSAVNRVSRRLSVCVMHAWSCCLYTAFQINHLTVWMQSWKVTAYIGCRPHSLSTYKPTHADKHQHIYMHMHCKLPCFRPVNREVKTVRQGPIQETTSLDWERARGVGKIP